MKRIISNLFEILVFDTDHIDCKPANNAFFELVFVETGGGYRTVDNLQLPFKAHDLFIHLPAEKNAIHLTGNAVLYFFKFQKQVFEQNRTTDFSASDWFSSIEFILHSNQEKQQTIIKSPENLQSIKTIIQLILSEHSLKNAGEEVNLKALLILLINTVVRNILIPITSEVKSNPRSEFQDILNHIHFYIADPKKLSIKYISGLFSISANYFGEYFLSQAGIGYKRYILEYRTRLVENRLTFSNDTLSQTAHDLGFSDVSHLNKIYKQLRGIYPSNVRKSS